ncbi:hypothetical protein M011DRAFT_227744 [Sporormia fimetaria CBS 119925]|uniref:Uncharacterized protein n=1 Tax=Sporormia fimetaria CBS 119925 TaxID=1340428 RepID=A0A6A6UY71_9PLEO|nr:hypothetical protein M011DRAFT_227744 [Sporormia fimetaria CBS 119925]
MEGRALSAGSSERYGWRMMIDGGYQAIEDAQCTSWDPSRAWKTHVASRRLRVKSCAPRPSPAGTSSPPPMPPTPTSGYNCHPPPRLVDLRPHNLSGLTIDIEWVKRTNFLLSRSRLNLLYVPNAAANIMDPRPQLVTTHVPRSMNHLPEHSPQPTPSRRPRSRRNWAWTHTMASAPPKRNLASSNMALTRLKELKGYPCGRFS